MEKGEKNRGGGRVKERGIEMVVNFLVRAILGAALIFFVNQFLDSQEISVAVGLNPITFLTGGILGLPGIALLYGIVCWKILYEFHTDWRFIKNNWTKQSNQSIMQITNKFFCFIRTNRSLFMRKRRESAYLCQSRIGYSYSWTDK